jgi:hypothetical protein
MILVAALTQGFPHPPNLIAALLSALQATDP